MGEAGIFHDNERLELIDGEIVKMTPIGSRHAHCVNRMTEFLITHLSSRFKKNKNQCKSALICVPLQNLGDNKIYIRKRVN
jgi:hypothetical protein